MTLRMADSIKVANLAGGYDCYAGYVNGFWPTFAVLKKAFPHIRLLSIAVNAGADADCLDIENGDATDADAPAWIRRQMKRGEARPCVYTSAGNATDLIRLIEGDGIARSQFRLWSAHYGEGKHICGPHVKNCGFPAADGTQWTDTAPGRNGSEIDESLLRDGFFGGSVSLTGPEHWDAADWRAVSAHGIGVWWLAHAAGGSTTAGMTAQEKANVTAAHKALAGLVPTAANIADAVVAALPSAATGGLTIADVETAVAAVLERAATGGSAG
jgi:hypothetical protein